MTDVLLAAGQTVSGGISIFGIGIPAAIIIAFLLGCFVGHKWL
jgi:hypothetical protein